MKKQWQGVAVAVLCAVTLLGPACLPGRGAETAVMVQVASIDALLGEVSILNTRLNLSLEESAVVGMLGGALKAPGLVGLDRSKPLQIRVMLPAAAAGADRSSMPQPAAVLLLPLAGDGALYAGSLEQMFAAPVQQGKLKCFGEPGARGASGVYMGTAAGYAVLGSDSGAVEEVLTNLEQNGLVTTMFLQVQGTIRARISPATVIQLIELGSQATTAAMQQQQMPPNMTMDPAKVLKAEADAAVAVLRQVESLAVGLKVMQTSVDFFSQVDPVPGTALAKIIGALRPPSAPYAAFVPDDALFAVSGSGMSAFDTIAEPYGKLVEEIYGAMGPQFSSLAPALTKAMRDIKGLYAGDYAVGVVADKQGDLGLIEAIALVDPVKAKEVMDRMLATYNENWAGVTPGMTLQQDATRTRDGVEIKSLRGYLLRWTTHYILCFGRRPLTARMIL